MKRLFLILALAIAAVGFSAGPALANNGSNTIVTHYTASYTDFAGPVTCTGVHQTGKNFPGDATSGGQDSFTCTSSTGSPLTGVTPGQVINVPVGGWFSDYFAGLTPSLFVLNTIAFTLTVSADGFSYSGVADYYPV